MHEQSLVRALLKQVDVIRRDHGAAQVDEVRVTVGPLSGVEPLLLSVAFDQLASDRSVSDARLVIDEVMLQAECRECQKEFEITDFVFRCPTCGGNVHVTCGDEFQLVSVSLKSGLPATEMMN